MAQPLSARLSGGVCFLPHPLPAGPSAPPYGGPTPKGGRRAYHVPRMNHGWCRLCLFAGGSTATAGERERPCTWPCTIWFKSLSAFGLSVLATRFDEMTVQLHNRIHPDRRPRILGRHPDTGYSAPGPGPGSLQTVVRRGGHHAAGADYPSRGTDPFTGSDRRHPRTVSFTALDTKYLES